MDDINALVERLRHQPALSFSGLPDLELYKDQVLAFLSRQELSLREGDQLTSAMINNYTKDGLMPRAHGKKYAREHLAYLTLICRLKQVLSVKDTDLLLKEALRDEPVELLFNRFSALLHGSLQSLAEEIEQSGSESLSSTVLELAVSSYVNKIACEYLIDCIARQGQTEKVEEDKEKKEKDAPKR